MRAGAPTTHATWPSLPTSLKPLSIPLIDDLLVMTVAPEVPGALDLIERLALSGIAVSLGHSATDLEDRPRRVCGGAPVRRPTCSTP